MKDDTEKDGAELGLIEIYAVRIEERLAPSVDSMLLSKLPREKRERLQRFHKWQDAHASLFAELLVRRLAMEALNCRNTEILFSVEASGKPFLPHAPDFHFNLSHSGNWVVCAVDRREVGVDIEHLQAIDLSVAEHYFSPDEHRDIINAKNPAARFFDYWSLKESYVKFTGKGLSQALNSFCIRYVGQDAIRIEAEGKLLEAVFFRTYPIDENYRLAVCGSHNSFAAECTICSVEDVIRFMKGAESFA